jgi:recombinational DNA repair protein (RecF pathway)
MSITKTEAIVLKSIKFGDTSRIATLYQKPEKQIIWSAADLFSSPGRLLQEANLGDIFTLPERYD